MMSAIPTSTASASAAGVESLTFGLMDYLVFTFMLCSSAAIGIYFGFFSKAKNTTEEYLQGGKKMQMWPIAISLVASQLSGIAIMSMPAETYTYGFNYIFVVLSMMAVVPILIYIIVPVFYENNVSNCYEYLEMRFNKSTRQLVTFLFVMNSFLMLPVYMFIPAMAFSQVTGCNIHLINTMVSSICVFYTMLGGIKAVVWTDVVQGGIMLFSVVMVGVLGTMRTGGLGTVLELASEGDRLNFENPETTTVRSQILLRYPTEVIPKSNQDPIQIPSKSNPELRLPMIPPDTTLIPGYHPDITHITPRFNPDPT